MKKILVYWLMASFAFIFAPKDFFHEHDHTDVAAHHGELSFGEKCFICDFDYTTLGSPIELPLTYTSFSVSEKVISAKTWNADNSVEHVASRGPPTFS